MNERSNTRQLNRRGLKVIRYLTFKNALNFVLCALYFDWISLFFSRTKHKAQSTKLLLSKYIPDLVDQTLVFQILVFNFGELFK